MKILIAVLFIASYAFVFSLTGATPERIQSCVDSGYSQTWCKHTLSQ